MDRLLDWLTAAYVYDIPATVIMVVIAYWNFKQGSLVLNKILPKEITKRMPTPLIQSLAILFLGVPIISFILWIAYSIFGILGYAPDVIDKTYGLLSILYDTFTLFPILTLSVVSIIAVILYILYKSKKISFIKLCLIIFGLLIFNLILNPILKQYVPSNTEKPAVEQQLKNP